MCNLRLQTHGKTYRNGILKKYKLVRQRVQIDGTLDSAFVSEIEDNYKIFEFLKVSELYN